MKYLMHILIILFVMGMVAPGFALTDAELLARQLAAAEKGDAEAQFKLGERYTYGRGVNQDLNQGFEWYRKAVTNGYSLDIEKIAKYYYVNLGFFKGMQDDAKISVFTEQAYLWFSIEAMQGVKSAASYRDKLEKELTVEQIAHAKSLAKSFPKVRIKREQAATASEQKTIDMKALDFGVVKAKAEKGDTIAQYELYERYSSGKGVSKDQGQASTWRRKAAENGHAKAQLHTGFVTEDRAEALEWYHKAAMQGYDINSNTMGLSHKAAGFDLRGRLERFGGIDPSGSEMFEEAYFWYSLAIANGHEESILDVEKVGKEINAEQIERAKKESDAVPKMVKKSQ